MQTTSGFRRPTRFYGCHAIACFTDDVVFLAAQHAAQDAAHHVVVVGDDDGNSTFGHDESGRVEAANAVATFLLGSVQGLVGGEDQVVRRVVETGGGGGDADAQW